MHGAQDTAGADDVVNTAGNIGHVGEVLEGGVIRSNAADANEEMLDPGPVSYTHLTLPTKA